jgi:2-dehydropantoate 2-reductase
VAREVGEGRALVGLCGTISFAVEPGRIRNLGGPNFIRLAERAGGTSPRAESIRATLAGAGIDAEIPADIERALWEKFLFVVSSGGVGAATRSSIGEIRAEPRTRELLERAMAEILAVGRARGVALPDDAVEKAMAFVDRLPADGTASLQRDVMEAKPSEIEAWNGAVVRLGREAGVATPVHDFIYRSVLLQERRHRGAG